LVTALADACGWFGEPTAVRVALKREFRIVAAAYAATKWVTLGRARRDRLTQREEIMLVSSGPVQKQEGERARGRAGFEAMDER
jgi:hypothetical protein